MLAGDALLWLAIAREDGRERPDGNGAHIQAAAVTELHATEWRKACVIVACGGRGPRSGAGAGMAAWLPLLAGIETYARAAGCASVRIMGRKGWARALPTYRTTRIVLEKEL